MNSDSNFKTQKKVIKRKIRKRRLKRWVKRTLISVLAFGCAFAAARFLFLKSAFSMKTAPAEYSDEEIYAYVHDRMLNTPSKHLSRIPVFAHRGFVEDSLYNSYQSFDLALLSGCPQIELDVRSSSDGVLYVSHDENLKDISASDWNISEHTSAELDGILMKNGEKLHRLSEVLERYRDQLIYLVEIKDENPDPEPFLDAVRSHPELAENIQVQSFYAPVLENIHNELPNMFVQYLINDSAKVNEALGYEWLDSLAIDQAITSQDRINKIHEAGKEVWIWTVDDINNVHRYLSWNADGVITDLESAVAVYKEYTE